MIRRDYILQLIKRAGPSLKKLLKLKQAEEQAEAQTVLQEALKELVNLDAKLVLAMDSKDLQDLLGMDPGQAAGKGFVIAELLAEYGETAKAAEFYRWVATLPGGREHVDASPLAARCL